MIGRCRTDIYDGANGMVYVTHNGDDAAELRKDIGYHMRRPCVWLLINSVLSYFVVKKPK